MQSDYITSIHKDDFFKNAVIEPPKEYLFYENNKKYTRIVIDSKDRNTELFPSPNDYEIVLDDDINDVVSVQLVSADVPFSSYMINDVFNTIHVIVGGVTYAVTLITGDYTVPSELGAHIQARLNDVTASTNFTVDYDTVKDNFKFRSKVAFTLSFAGRSNPLSMLLGFIKQDYVSSVDSGAPDAYDNVVKAPFRKDFAFNRYVYLVIEQFELNKGNAKPINKSFAALTKQYTSLAMNDHPKIVKYFSPTIPRLSKLRIYFYDRFGNKYDFQNQDHRLELQFTSFKQLGKYQNIFS